MRTFVKSILALTLALSTFAAGCRGYNGDEALQEDSERLVTQGKKYLSENRWGQARENFAYVVDNYDPTHSEARFGMVLADLLSFTDTIRLVSSLAGGLAPASAEENEFVNQLVTDVIHDLRSKFESIDRNLLLAQGNPGFTFRIKSLPIYLSASTEPTIDLGGEWDRADLFLVDTLVTGLLGALNLGDSIDLRFDVLRAYDYLSQSGFSMDNLQHLQSLITYILNDPNYPNFLSVKPDGGNELLAKAGWQIGKAVHNWQTALYLTSIETDDQSDDMLQYVDANDNGRYDPALNPLADSCAGIDDETAVYDEETARESFSLLGLAEIGNSSELPNLMEHSACLFQKLRVNLHWDDVVSIPAEYAERDRVQLEALGGFYDERPRINFDHDLLPLVASLGSSIAESAGLAIATPTLIKNTVRSFLGDSLEIDLYAFFAVDDSDLAGNLRGLLPVWEDIACNDMADCLATANGFVMERECRSDAGSLPVAFRPASFDDLLDGLTCGEGDARADTAHFAAAVTDAAVTLTPIEADGIEGSFPYIAFQDASFHGVLWLDLEGLADATGGDVADALRNVDSRSGFDRADNRTFNAWLAALSTSLDGILDLVGL